MYNFRILSKDNLYYLKYTTREVRYPKWDNSNGRLEEVEKWAEGGFWATKLTFKTLEEVEDYIDQMKRGEIGYKFVKRIE